MTGSVLVFAPAPVLTVVVEQRGADVDIHLHAGGQGVWQARMLTALGVPVVLCGAFGGETGRVLESLMQDEGFAVRAVPAASRNGAYIHDRRDGERTSIAETPGEPLSRHELDELYNIALVEGMDAAVCLLSGPHHPSVVPAAIYRRLASDFNGNGGCVVADLTGDLLNAVVEGGARVVKVSDEELCADGRAASDELDDLVAAMLKLHAEGAGYVILSRGGKPALVLAGDTVCEVVTPRLEVADARGAGDSMTAGIVTGLARGDGIDRALQLGAAAGALNVTRHGLGTGEREAVERLARRVRLQPLRRIERTDHGHHAAPVAVTPDDLADRARQ